MKVYAQITFVFQAFFELQSTAVNSLYKLDVIVNMWHRLF